MASTMKKAWGVVVAVLSVAALLAVAVYCYILVFGVVAWLWDFSESVTHMSKQQATTVTQYRLYPARQKGRY